MTASYDPDVLFLARYFHRGAWFCVQFYAEDWADAEEIAAAHSLQLDGQLVASIPVPRFALVPGPTVLEEVANLAVRVRNWVYNQFGAKKEGR